LETESDLSIFLQLMFIPGFSWEILGAFSSIVVLLLASALISGSEVALFSLTHNNFASLHEEKQASSRRILQLKDQPRLLLATILISNNFVNISIVILADFLLQRLVPQEVITHWSELLLQFWGTVRPEDIAQLSGVLSFFITVIGITFLLVLFGEVAPKVYATQNNMRLARFMATPLFFLSIILKPISKLLVHSTRIIESRLEQRTKSQASIEDIGEAIELTVRKEKGTVGQELDLLHSIVKFGSVAVKQIMTSRVDMVCVEKSAGFDELMKLAKASGYSRIPVYEEELDNISGILYVKDLLGYLREGADFDWRQIPSEKIIYVPESKKIDELLREFQRERQHMAIVVDEYGGTAGLVTLEDILEEIIGDIKDEFDDDVEVTYQKIDENNYLFEGKTLLNDFCRITGFPVDYFDPVKGEADSLAGLVLELCGQFPRKDAIVTHDTVTFKIVAVSKRRIEQVRVTIHK
jgi:gliding motility-associated protein GldE